MNKLFQKHSNEIVSGNAITRVQKSENIPAFFDIEVNDLQFEPGERQENKLKRWRCPESLKSLIRNRAKFTQVWLYEIFHYRGSNITSHGYLIFQKNLKGKIECVYKSTAARYSSQWCLDLAEDILTKSHEKTEKIYRKHRLNAKKNLEKLILGASHWEDLKEFEQNYLRQEFPDFKFPKKEDQIITIHKQNDLISFTHGLKPGQSIEIYDFDLPTNNNSHNLAAQYNPPRYCAKYKATAKDKNFAVIPSEKREDTWTLFKFNASHPHKTSLEDITEFINNSELTKEQTSLLTEILRLKFQQELVKKLTDKSNSNIQTIHKIRETLQDIGVTPPETPSELLIKSI